MKNSIKMLEYQKIDNQQKLEKSNFSTTKYRTIHIIWMI